MERIRAADREFFEELFRTHCKGLVGFARRFTQDHPTAENVVQDVFLRLWRDRERLDTERNLRAYLYAAVRNQSLSAARHAAIVDHHAQEAALVPQAPPTPADELRRRSVAEALEQAIAKLPERRRLIFIMNRSDHLTYAEIAEVLEISIKTVETQMGRALSFLREELVDVLAERSFTPSWGPRVE